jgi:malate dehydrogenase (oxaloacetate-decarboxylating)(NADP+)
MPTQHPAPGDPGFPHGIALLHDPHFNKGTAFTEAERHTLGLRGLLPPRALPMEVQLERVLRNLRSKSSHLEKYIFLVGLQDRNETLFYRLVVDHLEEMAPLIYTPTVGEACKEFGHIFRRPRGLYVCAQDRSRIRHVLRNWPEREVSVIVATDGERILGLGDLGAQGMGIPIGKLSLYTACAGVHPSRCLPVMLDVGTDSEALLTDPLYTGIPAHRLRGEPYDAFIEEFVEAVQETFPGVLLQWEDFATENACRLLNRYRDRICTFNDDIQGTAAVTVAALLGAGRITGRPLSEETVLFFGAGASATGVAGLIATAMRRQGLSEKEARGRIWFVDSRGLVVRGRTDLAEHKVPWAHERAPVPDLLSAVQAIRPSTLIGLSTQGQTFTEPILRALARHHERPIVFAMSNPTSKSECTAEQAYRYTDGRAVFASGSPFDPVELGGRRFVPSQANNLYVFPGLGLGVVASQARRVTDEMFLAAADAVAATVDAHGLSSGSVLPALQGIREVSAAIATAVVRLAVHDGLARTMLPHDPAGAVRAAMYEPAYRSYA